MSCPWVEEEIASTPKVCAHVGAALTPRGSEKLGAITQSTTARNLGVGFRENLPLSQTMAARRPARADVLRSNRDNISNFQSPATGVAEPITGRMRGALLETPV